MDTSRYRRKQIKVEVDNEAEEFPHNLSMYKQLPHQTISLSEFEDLAIDRLRVLRVIEYATLMGNKIYSNEWKNCIVQELKKQNLTKFVRLLKSDPNTKPGDIQIRRADHISHHILRIAYCRTEELRRWFLNRELELFKLRLMNCTEDSITEFMNIYNLAYERVSDKEKSELRDEINTSTVGHFVLEATEFYKVHFIEVLPLVQHLKVFLKKRMAYIPSYEIKLCIISSYRSSLSEALATSSKRIGNVNDGRITTFLQNINQAYIGKSYDYDSSKTAGKVNLLNVDQVSKDHFPLCMKHLHDILQIDHHLKHQSRLQYMFFLKALGMVYEDTMEYWRHEFTKKFDGKDFEKKYAYSVKHAYGKAGKMTSYSAYSCGKIISFNVGPGETHGCPFKHLGTVELKTKLDELGVSPGAVQDILDAKNGQHYQIACGKLFSALHGHDSANPINHPNQYFEDSFNSKNNTNQEKPMDVSYSQSTQNLQM